MPFLTVVGDIAILTNRAEQDVSFIGVPGCHGLMQRPVGGLPPFGTQWRWRITVTFRFSGWRPALTAQEF